MGKGLQPQLVSSLVKDIQDIHFKYTSVGRIKIESKDDMKKRLSFSPDLGDALCLTFSGKMKVRASRDVSKGPRSMGIPNWDRRGKKGWDGSYQEFTI